VYQAQQSYLGNQALQPVAREDQKKRSNSLRDIGTPALPLFAVGRLATLLSTIRNGLICEPLAKLIL